VPPYCDREGGFVCNAAITRYSTVRLRSDASAPGASSDDVALVRAAVRRMAVDDATVAITNDFPVGSGLGGSSAASAALLLALASWRGQPCDDRAAIAELGRRIEVEDLGVAGGRQDHYAATHGGTLALTFSTSVSVRRIALPQKGRAELLDRATLIYTGESRISGDTITAVLGAYERSEPRVVNALRRMRELAHDMARALEHGDVDGLAMLVGEHWTHQRSLHPTIPTARIDEIIARASAAGAMGAKAMGASGGGCVLVLARRGATEQVRRAIGALGEVLEFDLDDNGVTLLQAAS